jgi:hypothetical protein
MAASTFFAVLGGPPKLSAASGQTKAEVVADAFDEFIDELRRDYPDVYAQRRALSAQADSMSKEELGLRLAVVTAPALASARARISDDMAMRVVRLELDEYREALANNPQLCWGLTKGAASHDGFSQATRDEELRLETAQLRHAATSVDPPGPAATPDEMRSLSRDLTVADREDALIVANILSSRAPPTSDDGAKALCRWQMNFFTEVLKRGPEFVGRFVRSVI